MKIQAKLTKPTFLLGKIVVFQIYLYYFYLVEALCYKPEGSVPDEVNIFFPNLRNPSSRTRPWGLLSL
jgi:hypothetical protein